MADSISPDKRSWVMSRIKSRHTRPEMIVRSLLHRMGYRFRLHKKTLPGKPDIILPKYKAVIFVNGCFWHRHDCKSGDRLPKTRVEYWRAKLEGNRERDRINMDALRAQGWKVLVVWECMLKDENALKHTLNKFLAHPHGA